MPGAVLSSDSWQPSGVGLLLSVTDGEAEAESGDLPRVHSSQLQVWGLNPGALNYLLSPSPAPCCGHCASFLGAQLLRAPCPLPHPQASLYC